MKLGEYQKLKVIKKVEFGVYLAEHEGDETRLLLPQKQVPADAKLGDEIEVFLYKDSKDRIIATTNQPKLTLGGLAVLEVAEIGKIGADRGNRRCDEYHPVLRPDHWPGAVGAADFAHQPLAVPVLCDLRPLPAAV